MKFVVGFDAGDVRIFWSVEGRAWRGPVRMSRRCILAFLTLVSLGLVLCSAGCMNDKH